MATDYSMNLKAKLDTSDVQQKLQQLGQTGDMATSQLEQSVKKLEGAVKDLTNSWKNASKEAQQTGLQMQKLLRGGSAMLVGGIINRMGNYAAATGNTTGAEVANYAGNMLKGAGAGAAMGSVVPFIGTAAGAAIGAATGALETLADSATKAAQALEDWKNEGIENIKKQRFNQITEEQLKDISKTTDIDQLSERLSNAQSVVDRFNSKIKSSYESMRLWEDELKNLTQKGLSNYIFSLFGGAVDLARDSQRKDQLKMNIAQESADLNVWRDQATGA